MKKNKNSRKVIVSIIVIVLLIILGIFGFTKMNSSNDDVVNTNFWDYDNTNQLKICKKENDCQRPVYDIYDLIEVKYDYKELNKELDRVNKETMKLYEEAKASDVKDSTCDSVRSKYNYRLSNRVHFDNYENSYVISIAVHRMQTDLCTNETRTLSFEAFTYDKESKKLLTQEEIKESEQITDEEIAKSIKEATERLSSDENKEYELQDNYEDVIVYYGYDGEMKIAFEVPEADIYLDTVLERGE